MRVPPCSAKDVLLTEGGRSAAAAQEARARDSAFGEKLGGLKKSEEKIIVVCSALTQISSLSGPS